MKAIGYTATLSALIVFTVLFSGYSLSILWGWFFVPALGLPTIGIAEAIGIAIVVQYLTSQEQPTNKGKSVSDVMREGLARAIVKPSVALGIGWIVKMWV